MHIVTKVLVVFAAVLSVFLAALTISYATNADRIIMDQQAEGVRRINAEALLAAYKATGGEETTRLKAEIDNLARTLADRDTEIGRLRNDTATLRAEKARAESAREAMETQIGSTADTVKTQSNIIQVLTQDVQNLRRAELTFRQREIEQGDRISDLESQREVLEQSVRALQEQITEMRITSEQGAGQPRDGSTAGQPFEFTGPAIAGRVEEVSRDIASGATLARINLGSNDQVRENMKLFLVRGGEFLGHLVITKTDLRHSIGRIDTLGRSVTVSPEDRVLSRLQ